MGAGERANDGMGDENRQEQARAAAGKQASNGTSDENRQEWARVAAGVMRRQLSGLRISEGGTHEETLRPQDRLMKTRIGMVD